MITLIACGHSIGGVHSVDHPEIVSGTPSPENKASFDTTLGALDNKVVVEYLDNSTANPLVRNSNDTLNSDKRIFASDDNKTMKKLADASYFKSQCEDVFGRMLDLVPGDVTLTEPLQPADIKPYIQTYQVNADGSIDFSGRIRVRITSNPSRDPSSVTVSVIPTTRNGTASQEIPAAPATFREGQSFGYLGETFQWYEFSTTLSANSAFPSFHIRVNDQTYDNAGTGGYPVSSSLLFQTQNSCIAFDDTTNTSNLTVIAAVSKSFLAQTKDTPVVRVVQRNKVQGYYIPRLEQLVVPMQRTNKETNEYVYFTASKGLNAESFSTTFDVQIGDEKIEYLSTPELTKCQPL